MSRQAAPGQTLTLEVKFYKDGSLFDPFSVSTSVGVYSQQVGGVAVTTLTASRTALGVWQATWAVPSNQANATYWDEWTWVAENGMDTKVQRNTFSILSNFTLSPTQNSRTLELRLQTIEAALRTLQNGLNLTISRREMNTLYASLRREIDELRERIVILEGTV